MGSQFLLELAGGRPAAEPGGQICEWGCAFDGPVWTAGGRRSRAADLGLGLIRRYSAYDRHAILLRLVGQGTLAHQLAGA